MCRNCSLPIPCPSWYFPMSTETSTQSLKTYWTEQFTSPNAMTAKCNEITVKILTKVSLGSFPATKIKELVVIAHGQCLQASFPLIFSFSRRFQTLLALSTRPYQSNKSWKVSESKSRGRIMSFRPFENANCLRQVDNGEPAKSTLD